jgi:hypothetical protein
VHDRMPYVILKGRWCYIMVLNVHAPTQDKIDDVKNSFWNWDVYLIIKLLLLLLLLLL